MPEKEQEYNGVKVIHKLGDITKETTDCIVNAANCDLAHGGGVAYAISKAGGKYVFIIFQINIIILSTKHQNLFFNRNQNLNHN